ncbi:MAG TPA: cytochrome c biogenesis protein CcsA [Kofleriaceae bacterium]|jgi:heme exporter protein C|nr:cytochrome c biogenesis protein CcsA [Kofleriaceae bacterium]
MKKLIIPVFAVLAAVGIAFSIYMIFYQAPLQYGLDEAGRLNGSSLFFNQKIFYFHTAHAMLMIVAVVLGGVSSILFLLSRTALDAPASGVMGYIRSRSSTWDDLASASVDVAVAFGAIALLSGSIWAKAAWDVWWNGEPRLTVTLLLWLVLVGYVVVRRFAGPSADRIAAGMAIFGSVTCWFVYTMVGKDSHPASGGNGVVATLGPGTRGVFWLAVASLACWYVALVMTRMQSTRAERELRELRERGLDLGVLQ